MRDNFCWFIPGLLVVETCSVGVWRGNDDYERGKEEEIGDNWELTEINLFTGNQ